MSLKEVKLRLPADDLQRLDKEAQFEKARRRVGGGLDKRKVEGIVAFVFSELAS